MSVCVILLPEIPVGLLLHCTLEAQLAKLKTAECGCTKGGQVYKVTVLSPPPLQDICISAVKEKDIDSKLKQVKADWAVQNLSFSNFKTRGELLLRGEETQEIVSLMEDSLMVLGSLMSNRCVHVCAVSMYTCSSLLPHTSQVQCSFQEGDSAVGPEAH